MSRKVEGHEMQNALRGFGEIAHSLSKNPLGIIALFLVLVEAVVGAVTATGSEFSSSERLPLVYFMVLFPVLVLGVFFWLVIKHPHNLYGPGDFKQEENYIMMQMEIVASLTAARAKGNANIPASALQDIIKTSRASRPTLVTTQDDWRTHILWVDDIPENNIYERRAFAELGLRFTLALSTEEAFERLEENNFVAIISDMGRKEGPREGYALLDRLRHSGDQTPLFFYAASSRPEHKQETKEHGGQGCTDDAQELFSMVTKTIIQRQRA